jgi:hypothetical protein
MEDWYFYQRNYTVCTRIVCGSCGTLRQTSGSTDSLGHSTIEDYYVHTMDYFVDVSVLYLATENIRSYPVGLSAPSICILLLS